MEMGVLEDTFDRWHGEGLAQSVHNLRDLETHLELDQSWNLNWLPIEDQIFPVFQQKVLEETETEQVIFDSMGVVYRQRKHHQTIPHYIRFPVENEADYENLLPRLNGNQAERYPLNFEADLNIRFERGEIIGISFPGFFGFPRGLMGFENVCMAFCDQPQLIRRMIADRVQFAKDLYGRLLDTGKLNFVQIWEDMAYKAGPMVSPRMVCDFMLPAYAELVSFFRSGGVELIMVDSDGDMRSLLPIWLEAGVDGVHPCERAANCDPLEFRQQYPNCRLQGGMDKRIVAQGRDGIDAELRRVQPLIREGAFIPSIDHFVPHDISYETYLYYVERRREISSNPGMKI
jgi:uroporphyrinogen decarboxylase